MKSLLAFVAVVMMALPAQAQNFAVPTAYEVGTQVRDASGLPDHALNWEKIGRRIQERNLCITLRLAGGGIKITIEDGQYHCQGGVPFNSENTPSSQPRRTAEAVGRLLREAIEIAQTHLKNATDSVSVYSRPG